MERREGADQESSVGRDAPMFSGGREGQPDDQVVGDAEPEGGDAGGGEGTSEVGVRGV